MAAHPLAKKIFSASTYRLIWRRAIAVKTAKKNSCVGDLSFFICIYIFRHQVDMLKKNIFKTFSKNFVMKFIFAQLEFFLILFKRRTSYVTFAAHSKCFRPDMPLLFSCVSDDVLSEGFLFEKLDDL